MPKWSIWRVFGKTAACSQTVLPDRSIVNWTNVEEKCQNRDIFGDFQTQWLGDNDSSNHHPDLSKEGD